MAKHAKPPRDPILVEVNDIEVDAAKALPLKMESWNLLRGQGIDPIELSRTSSRGELRGEHLQTIAYAVVRKAMVLCGQTMPSDDDLNEGLTFGDVTSIAMAALGAEAKQEVDRPTSTGSSPSPSDGTGDPETSSTSPTLN
jgi:hypothetical protein